MRTADAPAIWSIGARALSGRAMQIARVKKRSISATPFVVARRRSSSLVVRPVNLSSKVERGGTHGFGGGASRDCACTRSCRWNKSLTDLLFSLALAASSFPFVSRSRFDGRDPRRDPRHFVKRKKLRDLSVPRSFPRISLAFVSFFFFLTRTEHPPASLSSLCDRVYTYSSNRERNILFSAILYCGGPIEAATYFPRDL